MGKGSKKSKKKNRVAVLLIELTDRPVRLLSFFLENLNLSLEALSLGAGLSTCTSFVLVDLDLPLELLDLALEHRVLVRQRRDLLLLLCRLGFELLDLGLELLGAGAALIRLDAESFHALCRNITSALISVRQACIGMWRRHQQVGLVPQKGDWRGMGGLTFLI